MGMGAENEQNSGMGRGSCILKNLYTFSLERQNLIHVKFKPTEDDSAGLNFLARYY